MSGVFAEGVSSRVVRGAMPLNGRRAIQANSFGELRSVRFGHQPARDLREIRITQPVGAIGKSNLHRFGYDMNEIDRINSHRLEIEMLENVQNLCDVHTAGTRWG